jgi:phospholipid-translocating ATPase
VLVGVGKGKEGRTEKEKEGKEGEFSSFGRRLKRLRKVSSRNLKGHGHKDTIFAYNVVFRTQV